MDEEKEEQVIDNKVFNPKEQDFNDLLAIAVNDPYYKEKLVKAVIANAIEGDSQSLKTIQNVLMESKYAEENKFPISDERFSEIIVAVADVLKKT